jgi:hypothetical protein
MESVLTALIGRGNAEMPPCKLLRPDSETLELERRFRFELDAGGELMVGTQTRLDAPTPRSNVTV